MPDAPLTVDGYEVHAGDYVWTVTGRRAKPREVLRREGCMLLLMYEQEPTWCDAIYTYKHEEDAVAAITKAMLDAH